MHSRDRPYLTTYNLLCFLPSRRDPELAVEAHRGVVRRGGEDVPARVEPVDRVERARGARAFSVTVLLDLPDDLSKSESSYEPKPSLQRRADLSTCGERDAAREEILEPVCDE